MESVLLGWGLEQVAWDATMIISELTSNAALHAGGETFTVTLLLREDGTVRLEVQDSSVRIPQQRSHSATSTTGRGLRIIADLAREWGVDAGETGKTVWVELAGPRDSQAVVDGDEDVDLDALLASFGDDEADAPRAAAAQPPLARIA